MLWTAGSAAGFSNAFPEPQAGVQLVEDQIVLQELWLEDWHLLRLWINPCAQGELISYEFFGCSKNDLTAWL